MLKILLINFVKLSEVVYIVQININFGNTIYSCSSCSDSMKFPKIRVVASRQGELEPREFVVYGLHYRELVKLPLPTNLDYRACQLFKQG
ncbi:MAG: hypothetical protein XD54_0361 [Thermococcus sibiricus]|uniref:Uncharacterized protein n=1 Tax=Thermococcus sibiricus TaxID=172049 RepID=A0A101ENM9_9EURY|nr:MAG: hypothetical protein XD54_0361 [Thermococcus sibiricus]